MRRSNWSRLNSVGYCVMLVSGIILLFQREILLSVAAFVMAWICFNQIEVVE